MCVSVKCKRWTTVNNGYDHDISLVSAYSYWQPPLRLTSLDTTAILRIHVQTKLYIYIHIHTLKLRRKYQVRLWFNLPKSDGVVLINVSWRWSPGPKPSSLGLSGRFPEGVNLRSQFLLRGSVQWRHHLSEKIMALMGPRCDFLKACHPKSGCHVGFVSCQRSML